MLRKIFSNETTTQVDEQIEAVLLKMDNEGVDSEGYPALLSLLERLHKLKTEERRTPVSKETVALIAGNLLGILVIVAYEQKHVMTSKGFSQIIRPKGS